MTAVDCGTLTDPDNGSVNQTAGVTVGQTATYSCNTGYNLVGDSIHTCQATGNWSGSEPTCRGMLLHSEYLWSFHEYSENSSETILDHDVFGCWMTEFHMSEYRSTFPAYCTIQHRGFSFRIICHTHSIPMRLAELIIHLKEVSTCVPANMCSVYLLAFHVGPLSDGANW